MKHKNLLNVILMNFRLLIINKGRIGIVWWEEFEIEKEKESDKL